MVEIGPEILYLLRVAHVDAHVAAPGLFVEVVLMQSVGGSGGLDGE